MTQQRLFIDEADGVSTRTTSPDGKYVWLASSTEMRMSHWITEGELWQKEPAAQLFVPPPSWSFEQRTWSSSTTLELRGRRYPGNKPAIVLTLDVAARSGNVEIEKLSPGLAVPKAVPEGTLSFDALRSWLEDY